MKIIRVSRLTIFLLFSSLLPAIAVAAFAIMPSGVAQVRGTPPTIGKPGGTDSGATRQKPPSFSVPDRGSPGVIQRNPSPQSAPASVLMQQRVIYKAPPDLGKPGRRVPGASRGTTCLQSTAKVLTALVPEKAPVLTTSKYPTFHFYVPKTSAKALEFVLQDANDEVFYRTTFKNTGQPGVISLSLPAYSSLPPLEIGKEYRWSFAIICDEQGTDTTPTVEGLIKRVQSGQQLQTNLEKAQLRERAALYAGSGFWEDSLTILSQLRRQNPNDLAIKTDWEDLLKSVGLTAIASEPLAGE